MSASRRTAGQASKDDPSPEQPSAPAKPEAVPSPSPERLDEAAELGKALRPFLRKPGYYDFFDVWQRQGVHILPVHFYSPIPDTRTLSPDLWRKRRELVGVDMNDHVQLYFAEDVFPQFRSEYEAFPVEPTEDRISLGTGPFGGTDALVLYCMVRHFEPSKIIEVGSGKSTQISAEAALLNGHTKLYCIEPYPNESLKQGFPGLTELIESKVEEVPLEFFDQLGPGDILFIDSTHVVKTGSDVNHLIFEVLPRLQAGVVVHFHDIFLPKEMPWTWVARDKLFWTEQYLLRAFLAFNSAFEVLFANTYMAETHLAEFKRAFPTSPWHGGGSFWIRRRLAAPPDEASAS
jgi:hypothetical protein